MNTLPHNLLPPAPFSEDEIMSFWNLNYDFPFVSFLCLTYNHESYIEDALHGFLSQKTQYPFEILIHDDCSSDKTCEIIKCYADKYPKIIKTVFQNENQYKKGVNLFSIIFPMARGQYIAYCEGDDYWVDRNKIEAQISYLMNNDDYIICYTDAIAFNTKGVLHKNFGGSRCDLSQRQLLRSPNIYTLTTCFKHVVNIPPEFSIVKYGDKSLWSLLGHYGRGKYMHNVQPSMYRVHDFGVHSSASQSEHCEMNIQTASALYSYYKRVGNVELQEYFYDKLLEYVLQKQYVSVRLLKFMKILSSIMVKVRRCFCSLF